MDILEQIGLHDTIINKIEVNNDGLIMVFYDGVYQLKDKKEYKLSKSCQLVIKILNFLSHIPYEHIEILSMRKNKFKEIDLFSFINLLKNNHFNIDDVFYSSFSNSILIKGFVDKSKIEFIISEVSDIDLQYIEE